MYTALEVSRTDTDITIRLTGETKNTCDLCGKVKKAYKSKQGEDVYICGDCFREIFPNAHFIVR